MRYFAIVALFVLCLATTGCNNLSPRDNLSPQLEQQFRDIRDSQANLENNQNAIKIELGRLQNALQVDGDSNQVQQGWLNVKADGMVVAAFGVITIGMLLYYMHQTSKYKKVSEIISGQIRAHDDLVLKEKVMAAAWNTNVEKSVFRLLE